MKKAIIYLSCALLAVPAANAAWWSGQSSDNNISYDSYPDNLSSRFGQITAGPEGNLYCIWRQGPSSGAGELYFGKSTDNGVTWSSYTSDFRITAADGQNVGGNEQAFCIKTNSWGHIFVVWYEDLADSSEIMLVKSTDYGATWIHGDADFIISYAGSTGDAFDPELAVDYNDNLYAVWNQDIAIADSSEIHISISTDNGETWSGTAADRYISYYDGSDASGASIAITPNNDIYVAWRERSDPANSSSLTIMHGKSTDGGATFNSETADYPTSTNVVASSSSSPKIVADNLGNVHILWKGYYINPSPSALFYTGSSDGGATWSGNSEVRMVDFGPDDGVSPFGPSLAVTSVGKLVAVWNETINPYPQAAIFASYSHDGGLTWTGNNEPELLDFPDNRGAYVPDVYAGLGDTVYVVWNESLQPEGSNYYDILLSKGDTLASGADFPGSISGTVMDGAVPVESVFVEAIGTLRDDITDSDGNYTMAKLPAGSYDVSFSHIVYGDTTISGVVVDPNGSVTVVNLNYSGGGGCDYIVGDVNGSDSYNGLDITYGVAFFKGGPAPMYECECTPGNTWYVSGDVNASCSYNGLDITYGVAYFKGGPGPNPCGDCPPTP
jgi:hypothetical protein